jgi:hypothetical protein
MYNVNSSFSASGDFADKSAGIVVFNAPADPAIIPESLQLMILTSSTRHTVPEKSVLAISVLTLYFIVPRVIHVSFKFLIVNSNILSEAFAKVISGAVALNV